ncbi:MAG: exodeoxyribonuclease I [Sutterellaceae bacterium]|nr:exodeoxyribonuclease I [Sutterellaceae bacterium]
MAFTPNPPTIYWHDYETFGLTRHLDRPAQFAGMRTDMEMNPVGDPDLWYCKPSPDYLPQAQACMLTGITPQLAAAKGMPEAEFARAIHRRFNTPGTLVIGYNNFKFDDEVSRALFWRNLLDMYSHQHRFGCSRWDLYPFVLAVWALRDEGIVWPTRESDDPEIAKLVTFRLEKLTKANGIVHSHAHDALSDVEATALFAKLISQKQPRLWQWALANRSKDAVSKALTSGEPCVLIDPSVGQKGGFLRFVLAVATHPVNRNEVIAWDCRYDPSVLKSMSSEEMWRLAFAPKTMREDNEERLPLCRVRTNQSPFVCADLRIINQRVRQRFNINMDEVLENAKKLTQIIPLIQGTGAEALQDKRGERQAADDVDLELYEGFVGDLDRDVAKDLAKLSPQELAEKVHDGRVNFDDPRLDELLFRLRAHSYPETLDEEEMKRYRKMAHRMISGEMKDRISLEDYFEKIDALADENAQAEEEGTISPEKAERRQEILDALYNWGEFVGEFAEGH